jgi:tetratricopeptide (TPR) repeat protein
MRDSVTERAEWLEANNKALERELGLARAELLERVAGHVFANDVTGGGGGGGGEEAVKDLRSKLERMGAEVERLTTINNELRQLLAQEEGEKAGVEGKSEGAEEAREAADAAVRLEMHTKVVGSSPKSKDDESFLLDLAATKLAQGDLGTAAGLYRSHLALFTGTAAARSAAARRVLLLMQGHARSRAGRHLASHMVSDKSGAEVILDIAGELEKEALVGENRLAASALLELYLSHHSWSATVWHRLGRLRERDGRIVEALSCFQQASTLAPLDAELAASYLTAREQMMSQPWLPPHAPHVYVMQSATTDTEQASALSELHAALSAAGVRAVLVVPPAKAASKQGPRATSPQPAAEMLPGRQGVGRSGSGASSAGQGAPLSSTRADTTLSLSPERLQAGDIVVFPARRPPPAQWMHGARLRQALLVSWSFSGRDLTADVSSSGLDALPQPLWLHWHPGMVGHVLEGDSVKDTGSGGAADAWTFRVAASHSVLMSSSAPMGALLVPPLPAQSHSVEEDERAGLTVRAPNFDGRSAEHLKEDTILCRGLRRKCLAVIHDTMSVLMGSGFCPVPLAMLVDVQSGSPAHSAGLLAGDTLLAMGLVAGGVEGAEDALETEVLRAKDQVVRVSVRRGGHARILSLDVTPQVWQGDGLLGWTLDFNRALDCAIGDEDVFVMPGGLAGVRPRPLKVVNVPRGWGAERLRPLLLASKLLVHQSSWDSRGVGDSLGAVELEAALYDVCILVSSDAAAAVDWPIGSRLVFEPHVDGSGMPALLLDTLRDYDGLSAERSVLKDYIKSLPAALSSASHSLVQSSQRLFYTVALDVRDEAAACSFIVSARLSHPLATVEVLVRDVQAFYHTHAALILQLKERGLWTGVWLSQIPSEALEQFSASHLPQTSRLYASLLSRPLALYAGRGYQMACLVDPHLVMLPLLPGGILDKLVEYPWSSAPYMAWTHKGVMRLPLCFRPSALHSKLARATLSPPAGAEAAGKYLYRCMLSVAGFAMHKRLGDTNAILDSLGAMLPSTMSPHDLPKLGDAEKQQLEQLVAHPAWAAAQAHFSAERRAAISLAVQGTRALVAECRKREGLSDGGDGEEDAALEGEEHGQRPLEQEVKELRQRVGALQRKLSEAKRLEQGWQTVAVTTEKQLADLRTLHASYSSPEPGAEATESTRASAPAAPPSYGAHTAMQPNMPGAAGVEAGSAALSTGGSGVSGRGDGRIPHSAHDGREALAYVPPGRNVSKAEDRTEDKVSNRPSAQAAAAPATSTKIVVLSGRVAASRLNTTGARDQSEAPLASTPSAPESRGYNVVLAREPRSTPEEQGIRMPAEDETGQTRNSENASGTSGAANNSTPPAAARDSKSAQHVQAQNDPTQPDVPDHPTCQTTDKCERSAKENAGNSSARASPLFSASLNDPSILAGDLDMAPHTGARTRLDSCSPLHVEAAGELTGGKLTERAATDLPNASKQCGQEEGGVGGGSKVLQQQDTGPGSVRAQGTKDVTGAVGDLERERGGGEGSLTAGEERMVRAAVERLAREDAEDEQFRRRAQEAAACMESASGSTGDAHLDQSPGDAGASVLTTPCPPGFLCSEAAPLGQHREAQPSASASARGNPGGLGVDAPPASRDGAFSAGPAGPGERGSPGRPEMGASGPAGDSDRYVGGDGETVVRASSMGQKEEARGQVPNPKMDASMTFFNPETDRCEELHSVSFCQAARDHDQARLSLIASLQASLQADVGESMLLAQRAARQRAEALKVGRSMLTVRDKHDNVAKRDEEILHAARNGEAHPMFQRAVAAAAARRAPSPPPGPTPGGPKPADLPEAHPQPSAGTQGASRAFSHSGHAVTDDATGSGQAGMAATEPPASSDSSTVSSRETEAKKKQKRDGGIEAARWPAMTEPPSRLERSGASPLAAPATQAQATGHDAAAAASNAQQCGLGIGVGAAPHGTWKVVKLVAGGSMDRANDSALTRVQEGDILVSVDDVLLAGLSAADLAKLVKGAHGSQVTVQFRSLQDASMHAVAVRRSCQ